MDWIEHPDAESLIRRAAGVLASACRAGLAERGGAGLVLAGGSTPMPVYARLGAARLDQPAAGLDWSAVRVLPGDERWVHESHPASNLAAMRRAFGSPGPEFIALVPKAPGAEPAPDAARAALASVEKPFDACVLGMGTDGHFASLFPGSVPDSALDPAAGPDAIVVHPDPMPADAPFPRVSLNLSALSASRRILLLLRGDAKREVLRAAVDSGDHRRYPIAALLAASHPALEIHWSP